MYEYEYEYKYYIHRYEYEYSYEKDTYFIRYETTSTSTENYPTILIPNCSSVRASVTLSSRSRTSYGSATGTSR